MVSRTTRSGSVKWNSPGMKKKARWTLRFRRWLTGPCLIVILTGNVSAQQPVAPTSRSDQEPANTAADRDSTGDITGWIGDLESNTYAVREHATEQLIIAGMRAVEPISSAIADGGLETISRCVYALRQLALAGTVD